MSLDVADSKCPEINASASKSKQERIIFKLNICAKVFNLLHAGVKIAFGRSAVTGIAHKM